MKKIISILTLIVAISVSGCDFMRTSSASSESSKQSTSNISSSEATTSSDSVISSESSNSSVEESSTSSAIDYGSLTIEDMTIFVEQTATINPVFSKPEGVSEIQYEFNDVNISIVDGVVTGLVAGTETVVTATTLKHETTFTVTVTDYGTLTIEDITMLVEQTATITPVFSKPEGVSEIEYEFTDMNISIVDGIVTGLVAGTETVVTATTSKHETTFKVTVNEKPVLGDNTYTNASSTTLFKKIDTGVFEKYTETYGETFLYQDGVAMAGSKYMVSGSLKISEAKELGKAVVVAKHDDMHFVRFTLGYLSENSYQIATDYKMDSDTFAGYQIIKSSSTQEISFDLVVNDDWTYFFVEGVLYGKVQLAIGQSHGGFGGEESVTTISNLSGTVDSTVIDAKLAPLAINFSTHVTKAAAADSNVFIKQEDGSFKKDITTYKQSFYYEDGRAIAGSSYIISGRIQLVSSTSWSQAVILLAKDNNNMFRYVFERTDVNGKYQLFSDRKVNGAFGNWKLELSGATRPNYIDFKIAVIGGANYFYVNGQFISKIAVNLGVTHVGFASDKGQLVLSNLHGTVGEDIRGVSLDKNELTLGMTESATLLPTINPSITSYTDLIWSSSDNNIAKVDSNGKVYGVNYGTATITVSSRYDATIKDECVVTVPYGENRMVFYPTADVTSGNGTAVDTNYAGKTFLAVTNSTTIGRKTYIKFDVSGLSGEVTNAVVRLYSYQINKDATRTLDVYETSSDWEETTLTWNNAPTQGEKITSLTITNTTGANDTKGYWFDINITDFLDLSTGTISMMLENVGTVSDDGVVFFAPMEKGPVECRPRLVIDGTTLTFQQPTA